jgi:hypothetical protein
MTHVINPTAPIVALTRRSTFDSHNIHETVYGRIYTITSSMNDGIQSTSMCCSVGAEAKTPIKCPMSPPIDGVNRYRPAKNVNGTQTCTYHAINNTHTHTHTHTHMHTHTHTHTHTCTCTGDTHETLTRSYQQNTQKYHGIDSKHSYHMPESSNANVVPFDVGWIRCRLHMPVGYTQSHGTRCGVDQIASHSILDEANALSLYAPIVRHATCTTDSNWYRHTVCMQRWFETIQTQHLYACAAELGLLQCAH